jgi:glucose-1-phosphatase
MPTAPSPSPIDAMIFDIGNVLLRFDFNVALQKLARHCGPAVEVIPGLIEPAKAAYEGGRISRTAFQSEVWALLGYGGSESEFVAAWEDIFTENQPMVDLVRQLHGNLPLFLLSNTNDLHVDFIFRRYPYFHLFQDAVYSYRVRASKPEPAIFEIAARQFSVNPGRTLFIDDLLPNIEAARAAGFRAHHYHHGQHGALIEELQASGLLEPPAGPSGAGI